MFGLVGLFMIIKNKSALEGSESKEETVYWVCQDPVNMRGSPYDVAGSEAGGVRSIQSRFGCPICLI
jgi:hypothetical protein